MKLKKLIALFSVAFLSCGNPIESHNTLQKVDIERIQSLGLLDKDEKIFKFYSEYKNEVAGNFFTNKRLAKYWLDENREMNRKVNFAFYNDIKKIDTVYYAGLTYAPYMLVTKKDGSSFKVCVDGEKEEIKLFFEGALSLWNEKRD